MKITRTLVAVVALLLVGATTAQAKVLPLTGSTTVTPSAQATQFLADNDVSVAPVGKATAENGSFVFPIAAGFGSPRTFNGVLAHAGGLKFTKGDRSAVLRRFVAVRFRGRAVLLAQIPGLRGGCGQLAGFRHARPVRRHVHPIRNYCADGRVIVLAHLRNLAKESRYNGALLSADLKLSGRAEDRVGRRPAGHGPVAGQRRNRLTSGAHQGGNAERAADGPPASFLRTSASVRPRLHDAGR
jgi:hypothetical protein